MMHPTRILLAFTVALLVTYDLWAMMTHGYSWTISKDMREFAGKYPIVPFALGIVFGHLYWSRHPEPKAETPVHNGDGDAD